MSVRFTIAAGLLTLAAGSPWPAAAQSPAPSSEQLEADYRVIAARCGTPAFEKAFYKQSKAAVAAGLVTKHRDPVQVEKMVTALRRNPVDLVSTQADCPSQLERVKEVQKDRSKSLGGPRRAVASEPHKPKPPAS
jgi:hypothetical protein